MCFRRLLWPRELRARSWQVLWLGTRRGLEAQLVPAEQIPIEWLSVSGLRGKGVLTWLKAPLLLLRALLQALAVIRRRRPDGGCWTRRLCRRDRAAWRPGCSAGRW